jgi:hypothetical protein
MKALHFCTPLKLAEIKSNNLFCSIRTGWIPELYPKDIIKINERVTIEKKNIDTYLFDAEILHVEPLQYKQLKEDSKYQEELDRYGKKFNDAHWFFRIWFEKKAIQQTLN